MFYRYNVIIILFIFIFHFHFYFPCIFAVATLARGAFGATPRPASSRLASPLPSKVSPSLHVKISSNPATSQCCVRDFAGAARKRARFFSGSAAECLCHFIPHVFFSCFGWMIESQGCQKSIVSSGHFALQTFLKTKRKLFSLVVDLCRLPEKIFENLSFFLVRAGMLHPISLLDKGQSKYEVWGEWQGGGLCAAWYSTHRGANLRAIWPKQSIHLSPTLWEVDALPGGLACCPVSPTSTGRDWVVALGATTLYIR